MELPFTKMHGCGNDYIYINCLQRQLSNPAGLSKRLSDRHFGVGGDGLVLICPSQTADARMRMFNADGSEGSMCGNAIRCVGKYLYDNGLVRGEQITVETKSGVKTLRLFIQDGEAARVRVDMGPAEFSPARIPVALEGARIVNRPVRIGGEAYAITCVSMGNPHCVVFCDDPYRLDLEKTGPVFENSPLFPERVNTEFVRVIDQNTLQMRVWERGSGETWACGTGACAAAAAAVENGVCPKDADITVRLRGGDLSIRVTGETIWMTGGAVKVFEGVVLL